MADIKVFAENLEDSTKEQIEEISSCPAFEGAKIRIMPDAHKGKGCVIGFTANLGDKVIPNLVGSTSDAGCIVCRLRRPLRATTSFSSIAM